MTQAARALTPELLDRFAEASRRAGGPLLDVIEPGLTDQAIDRLFAEVGLPVPPEMRVLWRWGAMPERPSNIRAWEIHPYFELLPPRRAVDATIERRNDPLLEHQPSLVVFAVEQAPRYLLADTQNDAGVSRVMSSEDNGSVVAAALSMGDLFGYWLGQIESGDSFHDGHRWQQSEYAEPEVPLNLARHTCPARSAVLNILFWWSTARPPKANLSTAYNGRPSLPRSTRCS